MISSIKVTSRAASMEEAEREIEVFANHARMAGYLEGIAPQSSRWEDGSHFERVQGNDPWTERGMGCLGRATIKFDPEGPFECGLQQAEFDVAVFDPEAFPIERALRELRSAGARNLGEDTDADRAAEAAHGPSLSKDLAAKAFTKLSEAWEQREVVSDDVIVLRRVRPALRAADDGLLAEVDLGPAKPTAEELRRFSDLALRDEVTAIAYAPARSRRGFDVELFYLVPCVGNQSMSIGGQRTFYGATFSAALDAAVAEFEEALRSGMSGTVSDAHTTTVVLR